MGCGPRVQIWFPHAAHLLEEKGLLWGNSKELTRLRSCLQTLVNKKLKLVNMIQVMLVRQILPCQRRAVNLWEFVPTEHRTLQRLYDMTHKSAWKELFKASEVPPPISEDSGLHVARAPCPVSS